MQANIVPISFDSRTRYLVVFGILYQIAVILAFTLGMLPLFGALLAAPLVVLLYLIPLRVVLILFIASIFVDWKPVGSYKLSDWVSFYFVTYFLGTALVNSQRFRRSPLFFHILFFLITVAISLFDPFDQMIALKRYARYVFIFIAFWCMHNHLVKSKNFKVYLDSYIIFAILASITMFVELYLGTTTRTFGIGGIPFNDILVAANVVALAHIIFRQDNKAWHFFAAFFLFVALVVTQTRGSWLSFLLTSLFFAIYLFRAERARFRRFFKKMLALATLVGAASALFFIFFMPDLDKSLAQRTSQLAGPQSTNQVTSIVSRIFIWDTAIAVFKENPINGIGIDLFPFASRYYHRTHPIIYQWFIADKDPHLLFLTFLCETGIIGTIGFTVLIFGGFGIGRKCFRLARSEEEKSIALAVLGVMFFVIASSCYAGSWFQGQNSNAYMFFLALNSAFYQHLKARYASA